MKTKTTNKPDVVYDICEQMLRNSPERSFKRLNPALRSTLSNCIESDLPFNEDTFARIYNDLRGGYWFGDGAGSHIGEHFYTQACGANHASAQQSFEMFAGRPVVLWEEQVKTPMRLHGGAQFTWNGHYVTVTSMRKDSLVACTYHGYAGMVEGLNPGANFYLDDGYWTIVSREGKGTKEHSIKVTKADPECRGRVVKQRFVIPYTEITELRKTAKARVRAIVKQIEDPASDLAAIRRMVNSEHFRHFDLEVINAAMAKRAEKLTSAEKVQSWRSGQNGTWLGVDEILLRVNNDRVECSNGNSIKKATARAVLPVLLANRQKATTLDLPVDSYRVDRVDSKGVKIGCTFVPWAEIDLIAPELAL